MTGPAPRFGELPDCISYSMPSTNDLPSNVADWQVDAGRVALLIHDMQRYFLRPLTRGASPYRALVENVARLRNVCSAAGIPVGYTAQPGGMTLEQRGLLRHFWGAGMTTDPTDRAIVAELAPTTGDRLFVKWRYSAFHASDLADWLTQNRRDQLIICGVYAHVGVLLTAADAYARDIETFLIADAVADFCREDHQLSLEYAAARCAMVRTTASVVGDIKSVTASEEDVKL
ncbi:isochorismatase family protein [Mycobacterium sp. 852002-40037_SCH5390672]|uniref:isochorismatase family protein n=1 Tax=Mycobacterium sp. 852002-40037_SCH5390672 TaxID=1834089 RepID=UPI0008052B5D|nr:isochorismatase family protein [Mycobacterium sp. 852002-40037_SCH5390672]OBB89971.1 isochorismatase [Mycobacterium sp. 852002-40037_SCH5390672]